MGGTYILRSLVLRFTCPANANTGHRPQGWVAFSRVTHRPRLTAHVEMCIAHRLTQDLEDLEEVYSIL